MEPTTLLPFLTKALDDMLEIAMQLGDSRINQRPNLPKTNSPYAIITHSVGTTSYWLGTVIGGRPSNRDREAEFQARGSVAELRRAVHALRQRIEKDILKVQGAQPLGYLEDLHGTLQPHTQGDVLLHCFRELSQHLGQLELTRDILLATPSS